MQAKIKTCSYIVTILFVFYAFFTLLLPEGILVFLWVSISPHHDYVPLEKLNPSLLPEVGLKSIKVILLEILIGSRYKLINS